MCLPFGPTSPATSASIIAYMTCMPAPTARASRPSFTDPATWLNDTSTPAGIARGRARVHTLALVDVAHGGPLHGRRCDLAVARHLPLGRLRAGDRHSQLLRRSRHPRWRARHGPAGGGAVSVERLPRSGPEVPAAGPELPT